MGMESILGNGTHTWSYRTVEEPLSVDVSVNLICFGREAGGVEIVALGCCES